MADVGRFIWHGDKFERVFDREMGRRMRTAGKIMEEKVKLKLRGRSETSAPGEPPGHMSGALLGSIETETKRTGGRTGDWITRVGTNIEYARHLEMGSPGGGVTIRPKEAKALAIPVSDRARQRARSKSKLQTRAKGPREFGDLKLIWPRGADSGRLVDAKGETHYILKKETTIRIEPRPFLRPTLDENRPMLRRVLTGKMKL